MKILLESSLDSEVLELRVTYINDEMVARTVKFRDPEKTIAPGRMIVRDLNDGKLVKPVEFQMVSPMRAGVECTLDPNGGSKSISLKCRIEGSVLHLLSESYRLLPEHSYGIQVFHGGIRSEEINFSIANLPKA